MKKRETVTFDPVPEVEKDLKRIKKAGRGVQSRLINQTLRKHLMKEIEEYQAFFGVTFKAAHRPADELEISEAA